MKDILGRIKLTFGVTFGLILFILLSPVLLISLPFLTFKNHKFDQEYQEFLNDNNGQKFFCYTSRKNISNFICDNILPTMDDDINVIFLNRKTPNSNYPEKFISKMLYRIDNIGFPNIMKIVDGKVIDISLKKDFYNEWNNDAEISKVTHLINLGFQILDDEKTVYNKS